MRYDPRMTSTLLLVTGILTAGAAIGLIFPRQLLAIFLGERTNESTTLLIVRHWSLLIALVGGLLIYAAYHAEIRAPVMIVAATEKLVLGGLVLASPLRTRLLTLGIVGADAVMAILYIIFLTQAIS
jgi:hypothetical protein